MDLTRPTTLADVAARAGVSVATASRVLNGSPHKVSAPLATKVRRVAAELRYAPNVQAQGLARSTSSVVAMLVHDIADPYFGRIAQGILAEAVHNDVQIVLAESGSDPDDARTRLAALRGLRPRAALVVGSRTARTPAEQALADSLAELRSTGATVVTVGQPGLPGACVHPQDQAGATAVARHLVSLGHRRFTVVTGPPTLRVVTERRAGFLAGLPAGAGVDIITTDFSRDGGHAAGEQFCSTTDRATAVFVTGDVMAGGFCNAVRAAGLTIPGDVAVAGFDDLPIAADLNPPLTTVRLPLYDMGVTALRLALRGPSDRIEPVAGELVVRGSTDPGS